MKRKHMLMLAVLLSALAGALTQIADIPEDEAAPVAALDGGPATVVEHNAGAPGDGGEPADGGR